MNNLDLYNAGRQVPAEAKKEIKAGRIKGMTDINPMWRIKKLTEMFGPIGIGWYYDILEERIIDIIETKEKVAVTKIALYYKHDGEWSKPIHGTGGNKLVTQESKGLYVSDECFKMSLTDAISVACKALGIGADVYWSQDKSKYTQETKKETDYKKEIASILIELYGKDKAQDKLEEHTAFKGKDGKEVAGVRDRSKLSDARARATYGKLKEVYKENKGKEWESGK